MSVPVVRIEPRQQLQIRSIMASTCQHLPKSDRQLGGFAPSVDPEWRRNSFRMQNFPALGVLRRHGINNNKRLRVILHVALYVLLISETRRWSGLESQDAAPMEHKQSCVARWMNYVKLVERDVIMSPCQRLLILCQQGCNICRNIRTRLAAHSMQADPIRKYLPNIR